MSDSDKPLFCVEAALPDDFDSAAIRRKAEETDVDLTYVEAALEALKHQPKIVIYRDISEKRAENSARVLRVIGFEAFAVPQFKLADAPIGILAQDGFTVNQVYPVVQEEIKRLIRSG